MKNNPRKTEWAGIGAAILVLAAVSLIFWFAPEEKSMGQVQKIFYFHVPMSWVSFLAFGVVFAGSIGYLVRGTPFWNDLAQASARVGLVFNTLMLVTGSFWGKAVWGVWWTWDPRLTTSLILWFIYVAYLLVRHFGFEKEQGDRFAAVIGIVGFADVPVVALSITLWQTLHPSALVFEAGLTPRMLVTLLVSLAAFSALYLFLLKCDYSLQKPEGMAAAALAERDSRQEDDA